MENQDNKQENKSLTEEIQDKMYKRRIREIKLLGGKSREELIKKANTKYLKTSAPFSTQLIIKSR